MPVQIPGTDYGLRRLVIRDSAAARRDATDSAIDDREFVVRFILRQLEPRAEIEEVRAWPDEQLRRAAAIAAEAEKLPGLEPDAVTFETFRKAVIAQAMARVQMIADLAKSIAPNVDYSKLTVPSGSLLKGIFPDINTQLLGRMSEDMERMRSQFRTGDYIGQLNAVEEAARQLADRQSPITEAVRPSPAIEILEPIEPDDTPQQELAAQHSLGDGLERLVAGSREGNEAMTGHLATLVSEIRALRSDQAGTTNWARWAVIVGAVGILVTLGDRTPPYDSRRVTDFHPGPDSHRNPDSHLDQPLSGLAHGRAVNDSRDT